MAEGKTANVVNPSQPPLGNGKGATAGGAASGAHDFGKDPKGSGPTTGGRDFTKESRSQSEAKPEVVPAPDEIPKGGKILMADPGSVSAHVTGTAQHVEPRPFKGMK